MVFIHSVLRIEQNLQCAPAGVWEEKEPVLVLSNCRASPMLDSRILGLQIPESSLE